MIVSPGDDAGAGFNLDFSACKRSFIYRWLQCSLPPLNKDDKKKKTQNKSQNQASTVVFYPWSSVGLHRAP